jgi:cobalamin biosynthesis protein CobW
VVELGTVDAPEGVEERILAAVAAHDILRIKGFLDVAGKPMRQVVQGVGDRIQRYYDRRWRQDEVRRSELVVIGQRGLDRSAIETVLRG